MDWATDLSSLGVVALAGGLGAILGLEREIADKPAGLRTHIFVCAGSALLMLLGDSVVDSFDTESGGIINTDPIRVIQAIVIGISFLGTGTIVHQPGDRVEGLTTAASIFLTAGIGIAVAAERTLLATGTTLMGVGVLALVGWGERHLRGSRQASGEPASPDSSPSSASRSRVY
jgi:putative Mg2+ transporter-C (MgtC) family protein